MPQSTSLFVGRLSKEYSARRMQAVDLLSRWALRQDYVLEQSADQPLRMSEVRVCFGMDLLDARLAQW